MNTYIGFGFDVSDGSAIVGHCFVWIVGIRSTVQTLDDFPHIWAIWIRHRVLKETFLTYCLGIFTASIDPFPSVLMDCSTETILSTDFGLHMWSHPSFRILTRFCFLNLYCCSRDENFIETRYTKSKFGWSGRLFIFDSTSLEKHGQSTPLRRHLPALGTTGLQWIL